MRRLMFQDDRQFCFETLRDLGLAVYGRLRFELGDLARPHHADHGSGLLDGHLEQVRRACGGLCERCYGWFEHGGRWKWLKHSGSLGWARGRDGRRASGLIGVR
jgi:hypothetical protein